MGCVWLNLYELYGSCSKPHMICTYIYIYNYNYVDTHMRERGTNRERERMGEKEREREHHISKAAVCCDGPRQHLLYCSSTLCLLIVYSGIDWRFCSTLFPSLLCSSLIRFISSESQLGILVYWACCWSWTIEMEFCHLSKQCKAVATAANMRCRMVSYCLQSVWH